jgi:putative membrane-bound dehydrogenase-like protein
MSRSSAWLLTLSAASLLSAADIPKPTDAPKPMTPQESAAAFHLPDGFRVEVVASEPQIASPSAVCWDERGRMFVGELHGYNLEGQLDIEELNKSGKLDTQVRRVEADDKFKLAAKSGTYGVVKQLSSSAHDGHMDTVTVWAKDLPPVYGLIPARGGIIVACVPQIIYLADRDGDGKPDVREVLFDGFAVGEMWRGINCPQQGADGWIYFGQGWPGGTITGPHLKDPVRLPQSDFRIRADGSAIEPVTGATNTFGFAFTESGDRFVTNTTQPANFVAPLPYRYLVRNPDVALSSSEAHTGDSHAYARSKPHPWRQKRASDPAYFKFYKDQYGAAESEADGWFTAACGPLVYRDSALPGLHGQYFVCEPSLNLIHRALIEPDGSRLTVHRAPGEETSEFMASTDVWSHPIALTHGPDGAIWVVDYYREIIEDYSAIPRHLQQQYGVYRGHDFGRILRLTHRDLPAAPAPDMSTLDGAALVRELASPLLWRRQTAQRLLTEGSLGGIEAPLRALLNDAKAVPSTQISALRTLDAVGGLTAADVQPFLMHANGAVRIHAWQLADARFADAPSPPTILHTEPELQRDRRFAALGGAALLEAALAAASAETDERVLIQVALSLGQTSDPRAMAHLTRLARERMNIRWMDSAVLSSLHGRGAEMVAELVREPGQGQALIKPLVRSVAASRDDAGLVRILAIIATLTPPQQAEFLETLTVGRKGAPGIVAADAPARLALAPLSASTVSAVRSAAHTLEDTFTVTTPPSIVAGSTGDSGVTKRGASAPEVSDETFRSYVAALSGPRDLERGHQLFLQSCALCHRIKEEGKVVGPDLLGELGIAEESLLRSILMPSERIRPGYETTLVTSTSGTAVMGILAEDGATSLTLIGMGGVEQVLLRKDVAGVRRLPNSLMPPMATSLTPVDIANLLAWLRSHLGSGATQRTVLFDDEADFAGRFDEGDGVATVVRDGAFAGRVCLHVTAPQRAAARLPGWDFHIVEKPSAPGEFRYLRLAWRASGEGVMIELANAGKWPSADSAAGRYFAGSNTTPWQAKRLSAEAPREWTVVIVDLWQDLGEIRLTGFAPTALKGEVWFDRIELLRSLAAGEQLGVQPAAPGR